MTSPRDDRSSRKHILLIVAALFAAGAGTPLYAQDTTPPTTGAPPTTDTTARPRDTTLVPVTPGATGQQPNPPAGQNGMRPDSLRPDSLRPDSLRRDTAATGARPPGAPPPSPSPPVPPPPVDSALAVACRQSGGEPPDLLTVVFRASTTAAEREAVAREVGGTLLEQSRHQAPGAWYIQVPESGINPLIADRLILLPPVLEVGATRCPS